MKKVLAAMVLVALCAGCSTFKGGLFGQLQTADDALAVKYGIPVAVVSQVRSTLGIPDARTLPGPERILPPGLALTYDMLDGSNQVVDVSLYHRSTMPRIVPAGAASPSVFDKTPDAAIGAVDLESVLKVIKENGAAITGGK